ncbi:3-ketoacyl-ACP reductase [Georgenia sp.]
MPKVAMVTGGTRGIGLGITTRLLDEGYVVAVLATREEPAELMAQLREHGEAIHVRGSVAEPADHRRYLEATLEAWGQIDVLVNNAGVAPAVREDILSASTESFDRVLGINLRGPYFLTQLVAGAMIERRGELTELPETPVGTIVNVSSISAVAVSTNRGDYCISKAGVGMATQLWAARLGPEGIVVYEVRPGVIATDMTVGVQTKYDELFRQGAAPIPRWGRPADVAGAVAQLCAGQMPYSTGDVINVDGGMHIAQL